jgi:glycosyltransferase involved in cell wall biosynthesis
MSDSNLAGALKPTVAILLCTMQGSSYLREQLDSIVHQSHDAWSIWASDDQSADGTHAILLEYLRQVGPSRLSLHSGPAEGFVANFLSLTCKASISSDYYAYADQDDVWESEKLARAIAWIETIPSHIPALYCARTLKVDENNKEIGLSPLFGRAPSFANALVQSIGGGNTMVFNNAARKLLKMAGPDIQVVSHDWWAYMLVSGCGGQVFYDPHPTVRYRQHDNNLVGATRTLTSQFHRALQLLSGRFRGWNDMNLAALFTMRHHLTPQCRAQLDEFATARQCGLVSRFLGMSRSGVYRQTTLGNIGLLIGIFFNRV